MPRGIASEYKSGLTQSFLRSIVHYNPDTGIFTAKVKNTKWTVGQILGYLRPDGYYAFMINHRKFLVHRLAWFYTYGTWPRGLLDHINRDKTDNRLCNLRPSDNSKNGHNRHINANNTSGVLGVCWDKEYSQWMAKIQVMRKTINLGRFYSLAEATAKRKEAEIKYFGHYARKDQ